LAIPTLPDQLVQQVIGGCLWLERAGWMWVTRRGPPGKPSVTTKNILRGRISAQACRNFRDSAMQAVGV